MQNVGEQVGTFPQMIVDSLYGNTHADGDLRNRKPIDFAQRHRFPAAFRQTVYCCPQTSEFVLSNDATVWSRLVGGNFEALQFRDRFNRYNLGAPCTIDEKIPRHRK